MPSAVERFVAEEIVIRQNSVSLYHQWGRQVSTASAIGE